MKSKQIKLLKKQIAKLEDKDFDLSAWKISTTLVLEKIFGKNSNEIKQINAISQDMSSWTLRDNLGDTVDTRSKNLAKQILETCIDELEMEDVAIASENKIVDILKNELTGSQYKQITSLIQQKNKQGYSSLLKELNKLDKKILVSLLSEIIKTM